MTARSVARPRAALACAAAVLAASCAGLSSTPAQPGAALAPADAEATALGRQVREATAAHGSDSGIRLLDTGREAFLERAAMIEAAERSIDAQYYIWNSDDSGRYLASRLRAAAARGVRVRVLLDDINVGGRDGALARLDTDPNIEIRIYNPMVHRSGLRKTFGFLREFTRLNRRMHNKSFTVDGSLAILGGRNIGDEYFDAHEHLNFRDRDVTAAGPVVAQTAAMFDIFWNSGLARPITEVGPPGDTPLGGDDGSHRLAALHGTLPRGAAAGLAHLGTGIAGMYWAPARLVHDLPPAAEEFGATDRSQPSVVALGEVAQAAREDILIESAYLVMDDDTVAAARDIRARGVRVRALTNSLASNDVTANHAAYAARRVSMLSGGIELNELRPDAASCRQLVINPVACGPQHIFGLHAKTFVFDRRIVYVGSLNLNLRSRFLNAESGLVIESPELAARVAADIETNLRPENSWSLKLDERGKPEWLEQTAQGSTISHHEEPRSSWSRRALVALIASLPLEKYL